MNPWIVLVRRISAAQRPPHCRRDVSRDRVRLLWLFFRSHADLGTNWSVTLELRQEHRLITQGVYRAIRHPMYSALTLYAVGQALVIPNWVAGFSNVIALLVLIALRVGAEEKMMAEQFGDEYAAYSARTKRFVPGVW